MRLSFGLPLFLGCSLPSHLSPTLQGKENTNLNTQDGSQPAWSYDQMCISLGDYGWVLPTRSAWTESEFGTLFLSKPKLLGLLGIRVGLLPGGPVGVNAE